MVEIVQGALNGPFIQIRAEDSFSQEPICKRVEKGFAPGDFRINSGPGFSSSEFAEIF